MESKFKFKDEKKLVTINTFKSVLFAVVVGHFLLFALPIAIGFIVSWTVKEEKKLDTIEVKIVDPAFEQMQIAKSTPVESYSDPVIQEVPEMVKPEPPKVEPPKPDPPKVEPPKQKVEPPKTKPKVEPKTKAVPPKTKTKVEPKPKTKPKVQDDLSDLQVIDSVTTIKHTVPQNTQTHIQDNRPVTTSANERVSPTAVTQQTSAADQYDSLVAGIVIRTWVPPNQNILSGRKVQSLIRIEVDKTGKIIRKVIVTKSGFAPMDKSVVELLKTMVRFPAPVDNRYVYEFLLNTEDKYK